MLSILLVTWNALEFHIMFIHEWNSQAKGELFDHNLIKLGCIVFSDIILSYPALNISAICAPVDLL